MRDLFILMKVFADREIDWADVKGIIARHGPKLDWRTILAEVQPLAELKGAPEIVRQLEKMRAGGRK